MSKPNALAAQLAPAKRRRQCSSDVRAGAMARADQTRRDSSHLVATRQREVQTLASIEIVFMAETPALS